MVKMESVINPCSLADSLILLHRKEINTVCIELRLC